MKKVYNVKITERLEKVVQVKAKSHQEASQMVLEDYYDENIILTADDYTGDFDIEVQEEEEEGGRMVMGANKMEIYRLKSKAELDDYHNVELFFNSLEVAEDWIKRQTGIENFDRKEFQNPWSILYSKETNESGYIYYDIEKINVIDGI